MPHPEAKYPGNHSPKSGDRFSRRHQISDALKGVISIPTLWALNESFTLSTVKSSVLDDLLSNSGKRFTVGKCDVKFKIRCQEKSN